MSAWVYPNDLCLIGFSAIIASHGGPGLYCDRVFPTGDRRVGHRLNATRARYDVEELGGNDATRSRYIL